MGLRRSGTARQEAVNSIPAPRLAWAPSAPQRDTPALQTVFWTKNDRNRRGPWWMPSPHPPSKGETPPQPPGFVGIPKSVPPCAGRVDRPQATPGEALSPLRGPHRADRRSTPATCGADQGST